MTKIIKFCGGGLDKGFSGKCFIFYTYLLKYFAYDKDQVINQVQTHLSSLLDNLVLTSLDTLFEIIISYIIKFK